jgi:hypothetical protein
MTTTHSGPPVRGKDGFYTLPDRTRLISVTTAIKKGAQVDFSHWSGNLVAQTAIDNIPKLARLRGRVARAEMYDWLRSAAERTRDDAGKFGTLMHKVVEAKILGTPMPEPTEAQRPYVEAFLRFLERQQPEFEAAELVVANPEDGWAGTLDAAAMLAKFAARHPEFEWAQGLLALDWKTHRGGKKGAYAENGMQLAAYRRATVGWLKDGTQVVPPATTGGVVIHLRPEKYPDTGYRIVPVDTSDRVYAAFLATRDKALKWDMSLEREVVGEAIDPDEEM